MALNHGYGVVAGVKEDYFRDPPNDYGQYFHGNLRLRTPAGVYHCAIDVDSKAVPNGVQWRIIELRPSMLKGVDKLGEGWHPLESTADSGALDFIRNRDLSWRHHLGCVPGLLAAVFRVHFPVPWKSGVSTEALADLEPLLEVAQRIWVFGEPFEDGLGVHNIHQNQGDPLDSQWSAENGIWQDGATLVQRQDGSFALFCNKFVTQSVRTDENGKPRK